VRLPGGALAATKRALAAAEANGFDAQLALEARMQRELGRSADYAEGVAAFQQKRAARFEGAPE
jgi:2-(1,2-epoxy-1,2-dihydrophenyl)acetyl-CoA isomerase